MKNKLTMTEEQLIKSIEISRNKWLYTDDSFGALEKDMVFESKTYPSGIEETKMESFTILPAKKSKRAKRK